MHDRSSRPSERHRRRQVRQRPSGPVLLCADGRPPEPRLERRPAGPRRPCSATGATGGRGGPSTARNATARISRPDDRAAIVAVDPATPPRLRVLDGRQDARRSTAASPGSPSRTRWRARSRPRSRAAPSPRRLRRRSSGSGSRAVRSSSTGTGRRGSGNAGAQSIGYERADSRGRGVEVRSPDEGHQGHHRRAGRFVVDVRVRQSIWPPRDLTGCATLSADP